MKMRFWLAAFLTAVALMVTGLDDTAKANEEEGAKTLWGEILPADTDPDGDGWANMGFDPTWMSQGAQDEIDQLAYEKDFGNLSQADFNEAVSLIWQREEMMVDQTSGYYDYLDDYYDGYADGYYDGHYYGYDEGFYDGWYEGYDVGYYEGYHGYDYYYDDYYPPYDHDLNYYDYPYHYDYPDDHYYDGYYDDYYYDHHWDKVWHDEIHPLNVDISYDNLAYLAMHEPETLNSGPLNAHPYEHYFIHDGYEYHFMFDGICWIWSYAPVGH